MTTNNATATRYSISTQNYTNPNMYVHDNNNMTDIIIEKRIANNIIEKFFASKKFIIISTPNYSFTANNLNININYFCGRKTKALSIESITILESIIENIFGRPVKITFIKISRPFLDANILAKYISKKLIANKYRRVIRRKVIAKLSIVTVNTYEGINLIIGGEKIPSTCISGIKIRLSGRLRMEKTLPRITVQTYQKGHMSIIKHSHVEVASHTAVNKKGSYNVKVWICMFNQLFY